MSGILPQLVWAPLDGRIVEWGTAAEIAAHLGPDVTAAMIRNWYRRDGLPGVRMVGDDGRPQVRHPLSAAARIEAEKSLTKKNTGRGRPRRLDIATALG